MHGPADFVTLRPPTDANRLSAGLVDAAATSAAVISPLFPIRTAKEFAACQVKRKEKKKRKCRECLGPCKPRLPVSLHRAGQSKTKPMQKKRNKRPRLAGERREGGPKPDAEIKAK